jgi:hypothetical protein
MSWSPWSPPGVRCTTPTDTTRSCQSLSGCRTPPRFSRWNSILLIWKKRPPPCRSAMAINSTSRCQAWQSDRHPAAHEKQLSRVFPTIGCPRRLQIYEPTACWHSPLIAAGPKDLRRRQTPLEEFRDGLCTEWKDRSSVRSSLYARHLA